MGLQCSIREKPSEETIFLKLKVKDEEIIQATEMMAALCRSSLGRQVTQFRHLSLFNKSHEKELELSRFSNKALDEIRPKTLGVHRDDAREAYILAQEFIQGVSCLIVWTSVTYGQKSTFKQPLKAFL